MLLGMATTEHSSQTHGLPARSDAYVPAGRAPLVATDSFQKTSYWNVRSLGTTPMWKNALGPGGSLGVERPCLDQLSKFWGVLGAILGTALTIYVGRPNSRTKSRNDYRFGWETKISARILSFLSKLGLSPRNGQWAMKSLHKYSAWELLCKCSCNLDAMINLWGTCVLMQRPTDKDHTLKSRLYTGNCNGNLKGHKTNHCCIICIQSCEDDSSGFRDEDCVSCFAPDESSKRTSSKPFLKSPQIASAQDTCYHWRNPALQTRSGSSMLSTGPWGTWTWKVSKAQEWQSCTHSLLTLGKKKQKNKRT